VGIDKVIIVAELGYLCPPKFHCAGVFPPKTPARE